MLLWPIPTEKLQGIECGKVKKNKNFNSLFQLRTSQNRVQKSFKNNEKESGCYYGQLRTYQKLSIKCLNNTNKQGTSYYNLFQLKIYQKSSAEMFKR